MDPRPAPHAPSSRLDRRVRTGLVLLVLLVGATSAAIAWRQEKDAVRREEVASLAQARDLLEGVGRQIETSLAGSAGLIRAEGAVNVNAFARYATELAESSDISALAFEPVVPSAGRAEFEADEIDGPIVDFGPDGPVRAPDRPVHWPVQVVAPESAATEELIGFDLQGDPVRRAAAEEARETGQVVLSGPVPAEPTGARSFFVVKALYKPGDDSTEPPDPADHVGFISTVYLGDRLTEILVDNLPSGDRFTVVDGEAPLAGTDSAPEGGDVAEVEVANRTWTVQLDSGVAPDYSVAWLLGFVTLLLGGGLAGIFRRSTAHHQVLDDAARRATLLAELAQRLNGAATVDQVAEVVTTLGREPVEAAGTSIGVIEGGVLAVRHGDTVPEEFRAELRTIPLDASLGMAVAAGAGTLLFEDQQAYDARFPDAGGPAMGARAFHPIRRGDGTTIGAIAHLWNDHRTFDDVLVATLSTIADLTGQAIERARLAEATARDARTAEELARLAQGLATRTSSDDVTSFLTRAVLAPLGAFHAAVAVIEGARLRRYFTPGPITDLLSDLLPESVPLDDDSPLAEAARTGEAVLLRGEQYLRARYPHLAEGWIALGFSATANLPLRDRQGELIGALGVAWDQPIDPAGELDRLTVVAGIAGQTLDRAKLVDRVGTQARRSAALATLAEVLATARTASDVAEAVTRHAAAVVDAATANLALLDPVTGDLVLHHPETTDAAIRERYARLGPDAVVLHVDAVRTGRTLAFGSRAALAEHYPDLVADLELTGDEATAVAPLRDSADRYVGAVGFEWHEAIPDDDLPMTELKNVSELCAQALERAQLADAEHRLVQTLQDSVLTPLPELAGLRIAARYMPAAQSVGMGGDWYEGIIRGDDRYLVIVGDIAGHGVTAVAQMAQLRSTIGAIARLGTPVEDILPRSSIPGRAAEVSVATAALVEIDQRQQRLRYACAGHPQPLVRDPSGRVTTLGGGRQPVLGMEMGPVEVAEADFPVGAVLVCYTDGLIERRDEPIDESIQRLAAFLQGVASTDVDAIADAILERWRREEGQVDDVALAVVANVG
jgi:serine phosphatase RsbU (regulator of sigma subunit)/CHASE1-domain containing sensor protein/GAF domain-containing protein